ncbi:phosphatidate cytidylyltransferase [Umbelopsis sp. WA50703]
MPLKRRSAKKAEAASHSNHKSSESNSEEKSKLETVLLAAEPSQKKWRNWWIRTITTLIMIGSFFFILASGHVWVIVMVEAIQTLVYKEIIQIAQVPAKARNVRWFKTMSWYFLISTNYFLYGESIMHYFKQIVMVDAFLLPFATHHRFISFVLYVIGFVFFVANLKKGQYKFQFSQFCWTHMALLLVVVQSHFIVNNILEGMIWFVLPTSLVICNDIFAYICGFFWGRTQLIQLSPKKTVEGFVGAWICTLIFGFLWTTLLMQFDYMVCPVKDLGVSAWSSVSCDPKNPVFTSVPWQLSPAWATIAKLVTRQDIHEVWIAPVQLHALVMACFASLIAPFGGFFASGVKRAFNIKDFGDSIPGHGGMTDRMDCQFLMGVFSSIYYQSFIKTYNMSVGTVLATTINSLTMKEQLELIERLQTYLVNQGVLDAKAVARCAAEKLMANDQHVL